MERNPFSDAELAYTRAYADYLSVGAAYPAVPDDVDPERATLIRAELMRLWRKSVRRITNQKRGRTTR